MTGDALFLLQMALNAVIVGSFYAVFAVAFVVVHGVTNRFHIAFASVATWAGFAAVALAGHLLDTTFWPPATILALALVAALVTGAGLGAVIGRRVLAPLLPAPLLVTFVASLGVAIAAEEGIRVLVASRAALLEPLLVEPLLEIVDPDFPVRLTVVQAAVILLAVGACLAVVLALGRTRFGLAWRAISEDQTMARLTGVDVARVVAAASMLSALLAAGCGFLYGAYYGNVAAYDGFTIGLKALFLSVIGGGKSVPGAILGGFAVGVFETAWAVGLPMELKDAATYAVLVLALIVFAPDRVGINSTQTSLYGERPGK